MVATVGSTLFIVKDPYIRWYFDCSVLLTVREDNNVSLTKIIVDVGTPNDEALCLDHKIPLWRNPAPIIIIIISA